MVGLLEGKIVAITGATHGIGYAIAIDMAKEGAKVAINHRASSSNDKIVEEMTKLIGADNFLAVSGDIALPETGPHLIDETVKKFGEINVFVSNAGICPFSEFTEMPIEVYQRTRATNLDGCWYTTQAAARQMKKQGKGGSIIGVSSISALVGGAEQCHYTPTKAGILSLMQSTACAMGKYGIRANALLPGTIETNINKEDLSDQKKRNYMISRTPLGRLGIADDLSGPAIFLASDLSKYVTGAQILVDGGMFVNLQ